MTFKEFLTESKLKAIFIALCASPNFKKSFTDDVINSLIGNKRRLSSIDGNYILKAEEQESVPYILMYNDKLKTLHSLDCLEAFNKSLDAKNSADDDNNDFVVSELEKHFKMFGSVESAKMYFNKHRQELSEKFKKTSRRDLYDVIFVQVNNEKANLTFDIVETMKVIKDVEPVSSNPEL